MKAKVIKEIVKANGETIPVGTEVEVQPDSARTLQTGSTSLGL